MLGQDDLLAVFFRVNMHSDEGRLNNRCPFLLQLTEEGLDLRCCRRYVLILSLMSARKGKPDPMKTL